ncbi:MAG: hypothetical protein U9R02_14595 [Thermodesulfobacteriota bacterium]|nr:hypothetical protein [Thermodesulfobacteriota bacterium]
MSNYSAKYEKQFTQNLRRYASLRQRIKRSVERVLSAPYNIERQEDKEILSILLILSNNKKPRSC